MPLSQANINIIKITGIALFFILGGLLVYSLVPSHNPPAVKPNKKPYRILTYQLFDSTFTIQTKYPTLPDSVTANPNPAVLEKFMLTDHVDANVDQVIACYKNLPGMPVDTGYEKIVHAYLSSTDGSNGEKSVIFKKEALTINGKQFTKFSGRRTTISAQLANEYFYNKFDILIHQTAPYTYILYLGYNLKEEEIADIKDRMYKSIKIDAKRKE